MIVLQAGFLKSATAKEQWPPADLPEVAFCGRSNVGKSSCLNVLTGRRQLARVSRTPGRTRLTTTSPITRARVVIASK